MKHTFALVSLATIIISACAPVSAPTSMPVTATPIPTATSTSTPTPTATPTIIPTATPTPIPTLPPEQVGGLTGVPDPRYSNPELFDLSNPDAPIPQFVNAMRMAGIEIAPEQIAQDVGFEAMVGKDGKKYVVVYTKNTGDDLSDQVPILIWTSDKGWVEALPRELAGISGLKIGVLYGGWVILNFAQAKEHLIIPDQHKRRRIV